MSRGIGRIERAILEHFVVHRGEKCTSIAALAHAAYCCHDFHWDDEPKPTHAQVVAVRRALKRLQAQGYPLELMRTYISGRPLSVLWSGKRFWPTSRNKATRYLEKLIKDSGFRESEGLSKEEQRQRRLAALCERVRDVYSG
jgi:hypothetical protein